MVLQLQVALLLVQVHLLISVRIQLTGTYTVIATNPATGCTSTMTGTASVSITALPVAFTMTGGGNYCNGVVQVLSLALQVLLQVLLTN